MPQQTPTTLATLQGKLPSLIHGIDLRSLRLLRGTCDYPDPFHSELLSELNQSINVQGNVAAIPSSDNAPQVPHVFVQVSFSIIGNHKNGSKGLQIDATFGLLYAVAWKSEPTPGDVGEFSQALGVNNAWPYWREFVQSMTVRMGLPPLMIPLLKMDEVSLSQTGPNAKTAQTTVPPIKKTFKRKKAKKK